jgi:sporulation protein YlmC with PRC-barrel domain
MDDAPQEITTLVGREVYSSNGVFVGEVDDLELNLDEQVVTGLALTQVNSELFAEAAGSARGVIVPYRWVRAVGDVVLVNEVVERMADSDEEDEEVAA